MSATRTRNLTRLLLCSALFGALSGSNPRDGLVFEQAAVDVGTVRAGTPLAHEFWFINGGTEAIEVTELRAGCGCLTPRLEPRTIRPGARGSLVLEVNTLGQAAGPHTWNVAVLARNRAEVFEVLVELKARVVTEISVQPASLSVFAENAVTHEIRVTDLRSRPLQRLDVRTSSPYVTATDGITSDDGAGHPVHHVQVGVSPEIPEGRHDEVISITTDDPAYPEFEVPVTIIKRSMGRITLTPNTLDLSVPPEQSFISARILVRDRDGQAVEIQRVEADDPALSAYWVPGPGSMATLKIQIDRKKIAGRGLHGTVRIITIHPEAQTLLLPVAVDLP